MKRSYPTCLDCPASTQSNHSPRCPECRLAHQRKVIREWGRAHKDRNAVAVAKYRAAHPERARAAYEKAQAKYWATHAEEIRQRVRARYARDKEKRKARNLERRDELNARRRENYARNPSPRLEHNRRWQKKYPDRYLTVCKIAVALRRARKRAGGTTITRLEWLERTALFGGFCAYCDQPATEMDHVIPLSKGGLHEIMNVVPACTACNSSKRNHLPLDWVQRCP